MEKLWSWRNTLQLLLGVVLLYLFFQVMSPFLVPMLLGAIAAVVWYPVYRSLNLYLPHKVSAMLLSLAVAIGFLLPLSLILYSVASTILEWASQFKLDPKIQVGVVQQYLKRFQEFFPIPTPWIQQNISKFSSGLVETISGWLTHFIGNMPSLLLGFILVIAGQYVFLTDGNKFLQFLQRLSPFQERSKDLYAAFEQSCRSVVVGLVLSAVAQSVLMGIFFLLAGLPNVALMMGMTAIMGMVPVFGSAPISIGGAIYLFIEGRYGGMVIILIGAGLIGVIDNIIRAWVMTGKSDMHPLIAFLSVLGAVSYFGPTGIILGPVIAAVFLSFAKIVSQSLESGRVIAT